MLGLHRCTGFSLAVVSGDYSLVAVSVQASHCSGFSSCREVAGALACIRESNGTPLQYSCLENPMDGGAWWAAVHGVIKSLTWLSDFIFTFHFHALEEEMATHSSVLAWRIPGTVEPDGLPSMGPHRVGHDWSGLEAVAAAAAAAAAACMGPVVVAPSL